MKNVIDACKQNNSKLVFFDNVYSYGKVDGWMAPIAAVKNEKNSLAEANHENCIALREAEKELSTSQKSYSDLQKKR